MMRLLFWKNQCSVIVDADHHILGIVTDRDIRKALLKHISWILYI